MKASGLQILAFEGRSIINEQKTMEVQSFAQSEFEILLRDKQNQKFKINIF